MGRDLFKQGMRWRVGNGNLISIKEDPWIPRVGNYKPIWVKEELAEGRVSKLISDSGDWMEEVIRSSFLEVVAEAILGIQLGTETQKIRLFGGRIQKEMSPSKVPTT